MRSRAPWRPSFDAACRTFSISSGVRYSRLRREELVWRGAEGESEGWSSKSVVIASYCPGAAGLSHLGVLVMISVLLLSSRL